MEQPRNRRVNRDRWDMDKVRYQLSKPPAPRRDFKTMADILEDVVGEFEQPVQDNVRLLRKAWAKLVGAQIAQHSEPGFIKDFQLYVWVDHPGWIPELERLRRVLLQKLTGSYPELKIRGLRFALHQ